MAEAEAGGLAAAEAEAAAAADLCCEACMLPRGRIVFSAAALCADMAPTWANLYVTPRSS